MVRQGRTPAGSVAGHHPIEQRLFCQLEKTCRAAGRAGIGRIGAFGNGFGHLHMAGTTVAQGSAQPLAVCLMECVEGAIRARLRPYGQFPAGLPANAAARPRAIPKCPV